MIDLKTPDTQALLKMKSVRVAMNQELADKINALSNGRCVVDVNGI